MWSKPPLAIAVAKANDSACTRRGIKDEGDLPVIPANPRKPVPHDVGFYAEHNLAERVILSNEGY